jgi:hypothetical protein
MVSSHRGQCTALEEEETQIRYDRFRRGRVHLGQIRPHGLAPRSASAGNRVPHNGNEPDNEQRRLNEKC